MTVNDMRDKVMDAIQAVWDREAQIGDTVDEVIDIVAAQARADLIAELRPVAWRYQTPTGWHTTTDAGKALVLRDYHPTEPLAIIPKE